MWLQKKKGGKIWRNVQMKQGFFFYNYHLLFIWTFLEHWTFTKHKYDLNLSLAADHLVLGPAAVLLWFILI